MEIVEKAGHSKHNLIVLDKNDAVWLTFCAEWFDISAQIVWWLQPGKKAWLQLKVAGKDNTTKTVRVQAKRISKTYVRIG